MRGTDWKRTEVEAVANLARSSSVIGIASVHEIPARQLQSIRRDLKGKVNIRISKKTLISRALAESGKERIGELESKLQGEVALLFTDMNPFKLFRHLEDGKVNAPAKPGHRPPEDVWVPRGQTPFAPGPIVSQLQKVGIPARIERGKVVILDDTLLVKAGEPIDRARSDILSQLGIHPMRIGLNVTAVYEEGMVFERSVLDVSADEIAGQLSLAAKQAFNLAYNSRYIAEATIVPFIQEAYRSARSLSIGLGFATKDTVGDIIAVAHSRMLALASALAAKSPEAVGEQLLGKLPSVPAAGAGQAREEQVETKGEDQGQGEEEKEEESVGLGALFG